MSFSGSMGDMLASRRDGAAGYLRMADDKEAEIREIKLKIENLLIAANYRGLPQEATISYLKEVQKLRLRLLHLGVKPGDSQ
jgi:hypothetical protein